MMYPITYYPNYGIHLNHDRLINVLKNENANIDDIKELIKTIDVNFIDKHDNYGYTALMWASINGRRDIVKELIKAGSDVNYIDAYKRNALHFAVMFGKIDAVRALLEAGSKIRNFATLFMALKNVNRVKMVALLLKAGADPNVKNYNGTTILMYTIQNRIIDIAMLLIKKGADVSATNEHKRTALMMASKYGHTTVVKALIKAGALIYEIDNKGTTALKEARENGRIQVIKLLTRLPTRHMILVPFMSRSFTRINKDIIRELSFIL
jgi:ankyrin repeat protein